MSTLKMTQVVGPVVAVGVITVGGAMGVSAGVGVMGVEVVVGVGVDVGWVQATSSNARADNVRHHIRNEIITATL